LVAATMLRGSAYVGVVWVGSWTGAADGVKKATRKEAKV
jgi:hypothetical protein